MSKAPKGLRKSRRRKNSGSPNLGEPEFLVIGKLGRPHGVDGEIQFFVLTDFPERIVEGKEVLVGKNREPMTLMTVRPHTKKLLVRFDGFKDRDEVDALRNQMIFIPVSAVAPLPAGEYYHHQLIGLSIVSEDGQALGKIVEIIETGANDVYVVRPDEGKDILIPNTSEVILAVDIEEKTITVRLIPGLLPD
jgi:16S rRNA processing protein RimM